MPSLTIMGICSTDKKTAMSELVEKEALKLHFLKPEKSVVEIKSDKKRFWNELNRFCIAEMHNHFDTDFVLVVQFDGRILNPNGWTDEFFQYDYIGAPWTDDVVGNGGFSLRSRKFCEYSSKNLVQLWKDNFEKFINRNAFGNEDRFLCRTCHRRITESGLKFAPAEVADKFSVEHNSYSGQFGAHHAIYIAGRLYNLKKMSENDFESLFLKIKSKVKT